MNGPEAQTPMPTAIIAAMARARSESPFLTLMMAREPALAAVLEAGRLPADHDAIDDDLPVGTALRTARRRIALVTAIADLAGAWPLEQVVATLSRFADEALHRAIGAAIAERVPGAPNIGFAAIALGKQGSSELNYSSDIDPIFLFDPVTLPRREKEAPEDAAVRIGRRVIELLQARDGDGYVLRVDMRLRPSPEITPIALPVDAAISYYESQALPWERAAFIRARAAAGDTALGGHFLEAIRPFVWRRGLDFGALREIRAISRRVREHYAQGQRFGPGFDLKRGRGGIREIEFFAQIHQLIHGGRDPRLRAPATLDALAMLAQAGLISPEDADTLGIAYRLLRTIEHRLQMVDDRQTHSLPDGAALDGVARLHGLADGDGLLALISPHVEAVGAIYDGIEAEDAAGLPHEGMALAAALSDAGFAQPDAACQRIGDWRSARYPALRSPAAQSALEGALPRLVAALGAGPDPDGAIVRMDIMLSRLPSAINLFRLIEARPTLGALLAAILSHAPPLAEALGRRPALLDGLIDASALEPVGDLSAIMSDMRRWEEGADYQARLDHVRAVVGERKFALGAQIVAAVQDPLVVSAGYARVAEAALRVLATETVEAFAALHGRVPGSELVILALGRLGGAALTHASDLDLVFLFTGDHLAESDGAKPLGAVHYYNRLAQRVTAALSVPTAAGPLYEVDTRLRPSGTQGPLCVSLAGFERYQREDAWTWEHMALTRARPVFGSPVACQATEATIHRVLGGARPVRDIRAEAAAMRADMASHKPPSGPLDVKLMPGGLVDLEFAVHVVQLTSCDGLAPALGQAIGQLVRAGRVPHRIADAHDLLTRWLVAMRLLAPDGKPPGAATRALLARNVGAEDWQEAVARLEATGQEVAAFWRRVSGAAA